MSVVALEPVVETAVCITEARPIPERPSKKHTSVLRCLVVSEDPSRLELLAGSAADAGFEPIACADTAKAWMACRSDELAFAFVDLAATSCEATAKDLGEYLSRDRKLLVCVCGQEGEPLEEIWARQIGAWLYLPGIGDREGLTGLCTEARPVVERMLNR